MIGASSRIAGSGSRIVPAASRTTFAMISRTYGLLDSPMRNCAASVGIWSIASTQANSSETPTISRMLAQASTVSRADSMKLVQLSLR